ncbi:membrane-bound PQQ-dependent dehydrogenase, glucose/quinate/shikimate family [Sphingobium chlorophenolicum L-1]|uniref:Membrane-bound PQQ-dependent dehydrogenase, glucose/quinate/shikimate family n=1 Tax=Sphingobium chlorophenolicum L-1 TaxID=690566 RepID=F6F398_SPHCR|nr:membrane-bound PQQ-dependent dehydrogenase, glucose/quinate/shikimate family [Sphingobium chlorophenolicum]AEG50910.1 membrane-bound PQQ-dependent dehydrogenase, glucose/quinate/shikimate family [Sphingobium chlorophenolicum L-1]
MERVEASKASLLWFRLYSGFMAICGLALLYGGFDLLLLGGSPYYVAAGLALIGTAALLWQARWSGAITYMAFLLLTVMWAFWESGPNIWGLLPRLAFFTVLAIPVLVWAWRSRLRGTAPSRWHPTLLAAAALAIIAGLALHYATGMALTDPAFDRGTGFVQAAAFDPATTARSGDWRSYGNDAGGSRFSPLAQLTPANVNRLTTAWTFRTGPGADGKFGNLEVTPLKVGKTLYACTSYSDVIALDAETGQQQWRWRSNVDRKGFPYSNCRGVAYYQVPNATGICSQRIVHTTADLRLIALDAASGRPCPDFGEKGSTSLATGMGKFDNGYYFVSSAPTLVRGKIVVGGWVADGQYWGEPSGVIRAFDARTGEFSWAFDIGRPDKASAPTGDETYTKSTPNSWAPMSADEALGLVYAPTGNSVPDYYGGNRRPFDDQYSTSVVALDAATGRPRWSFQTVHHDLWDYDVPAQPTLVDLPGPHGLRKALIQATKRGQLFVLDRTNGKPIFTVAERAVPQGGIVPGERLSRTQPYSIGMPSLAGTPPVERTMWGITPFDQLMCRVAFHKLRYEGEFTPPGLKANLLNPGAGGGMSWGGISIDLDRKLIISNTNRMSTITRMIPRTEADRMGLKPMSNGAHGNIAGTVTQANTPYAAEVRPFFGPLAMPCEEPPYGYINAIDLVTQKVVWRKTLGDSRGSGPFSIPTRIPLPMGVPGFGGSLTTRGGLVFIGSTPDSMFRAIDSATGNVVWQTALPAGGNASPMTYLSPESGRQFVVIAAGGHHALEGKKGDYIVAYALPKGSAADGKAGGLAGN